MVDLAPLLIKRGETFEGTTKDSIEEDCGPGIIVMADVPIVKALNQDILQMEAKLGDVPTIQNRSDVSVIEQFK